MSLVLCLVALMSLIHFLMCMVANWKEQRLNSKDINSDTSKHDGYSVSRSPGIDRDEIDYLLSRVQNMTTTKSWTHPMANGKQPSSVII